jgi:hypothetical protein
MDQALENNSTETQHMRNVFWTGICKLPRIDGIQEAEKIIDELGFITDFKQFSDLAISLVIEIEACKVKKLYHALSEKFTLDPFEALKVGEDDKTSTQIFFNISFTEGHGDLKIDVPSVPG